MAKRDYYEILGVEKGASSDDIKKAYRKLAIQFHPDKNPGDKASEEKFKEATEAYEILSDTQKRARYDQYGFAGIDPSAGGGAGFGSEAFRDFEDLFGGFGDIFGSFFGSSSRRGDSTPRGNDLRYGVEIDFKDAVFGTKVDIAYTHNASCSVCGGSGAEADSKKKVCPTCQGSGQVRRSSGFFSIAQPCPTCGGEGHIIEKPCRACRGSGLEKKQVKRSVEIPAGIEQGKKIRINGLGEAGPNGGQAGDLYVAVHVRDHESFERNGNDLYCQIPISIVQAALGAEISVTTLDDKKIKLKIPAGTQSGKMLRVKEAGVPFLHMNGKRGDLYIKIYVEVPANLSSKAKDLLAQLGAQIGSNDEPKPMKLSQIE
ncbi:MAG: molecular chaperone DnaJ [Spirochaetales bacterium]|nr:molecular chaperone DnaJ [Spirochaetales bacterium]